MHDVHALLIVMQEDAGQPVHGPVMLLEQPFDLSFPVCHTLYIHTQVDLLNPFPQLFLITRQNYPSIPTPTTPKWVNSQPRACYCPSAELGIEAISDYRRLRSLWPAWPPLYLLRVALNFQETSMLTRCVSLYESTSLR